MKNNRKEDMQSILMDELVRHFINSSAVEGIILDWQIQDGRPLNEFINYLLEEKIQVCSEENRHHFLNAVRNISRKYGVSHLIPLLKSSPETVMPGGVSSGEPSKMLGQECLALWKKADIRILQISDLHFGKFHCCQDNFTTIRPEQALSLSLKNLSEELKPHFCIVSGDLTSIAASVEFNKASEFIGQFARKNGLLCEVPEISYSRRILVVPGNHDNRWKKKLLDTDHLFNFRKFISKKGRFLSPFGYPGRIKDKSIYVFDNSADKKTVPPFSIITYPDLNISFGLMTSCYYSGEIVDKKRKDDIAKVQDLILRGPLHDPSNVTSLLREIVEIDCGYFGAEYLDSIDSVVQKAKETLGTVFQKTVKIAVTHHPLTPCGKVPACHESLSLRSKLKELWGFSSALHGHAHSINSRPDESHRTRANSIACPTLSALYREDCLGVLLNCISFEKEAIDGILWRYDSEGTFQYAEDDLKHLFSYSLK
jgi:hypothetical protein